ncbi:MAG: response regulator transcription factor [Lachnospiraceae bacterium]|nr:response regulator transcription factor [Lachnospiraceae bacterium]
MSKILIIEDDENIANIEKDYLEINGFEVDIRNEAISGIELASTGEYDLILLDLMLPGMDGFAVCKKLRLQLDIPIIIVSAKQENADQILGLGLGADDFVSKPFDPSILVARVKSNLAQYQRGKLSEVKEDVLKVGAFTLNRQKRQIYKDGVEIALKNKEYELLSFFMDNKDIVFTKETLYEEIWGLDAEGDTTTVAVHVNRLRKKLEVDPSQPQYLETVWGVGYRFTVK